MHWINNFHQRIKNGKISKMMRSMVVGCYIQCDPEWFWRRQQRHCLHGERQSRHNCGRCGWDCSGHQLRRLCWPRILPTTTLLLICICICVNVNNCRCVCMCMCMFVFKKKQRKEWKWKKTMEDFAGINFDSSAFPFALCLFK
jgi:hypothetical protein